MTKTFSRAELYELVWTRPRTALAKELGVSDVAIGKQCVRAHIPAPPPGYWARLSSGGTVRRTPLPMRLPGQLNDVEIGQTTDRYQRPQEDLNQPLLPPVFVEDVDQQVNEAAKRLGRVMATRDLKAPDPSLSRVLAAEAKRRIKHENSGWSFDKPYFEKPEYQRQLRIFNSLARALAPIYGRQEVRSVDEWIQGIGTLHQLTLNLDFGGVRLELRIREPGQRGRGKEHRPVEATTLYVETEWASGGTQEWGDKDGCRLEEQLTDVVTALMNRAEFSLRAHAQWVFEQRIRRRQEELAAIEARRLEDERKRLAAIEASKAKVRTEVIELARRRRSAEEIRSMIEALRKHPEAHKSGERLEAWASRALTIADEMDPLKCSLQDVLGSFELHKERSSD